MASKREWPRPTSYLGGSLLGLSYNPEYGISNYDKAYYVL